MERIADAFVWPVRDPEWAEKVVIIGLLLLIPIAGVINGLGWMLACLDRLRAGEDRLPRANLTYLGRGIRLFVVNVVYAAALGLVGAATWSSAIITLARKGTTVTQASGGLALLLFGFGLVTLGSVLAYFLLPSIVMAVEEGGIAAGLNVVAVTRRARLTLTNTLIAGLMLVAAAFVGQLGAIACVVGVLFTTAYSLAMQAWIYRSFELGATAPTGA
jgi:hypothetical protein